MLYKLAVVKNGNESSESLVLTKFFCTSKVQKNEWMN